MLVYMVQDCPSLYARKPLDYPFSDLICATRFIERCFIEGQDKIFRIIRVELREIEDFQVCGEAPLNDERINNGQPLDRLVFFTY